MNDATVERMVFISHSHLDRDFAIKIQRVLARYGACTYLDQDRIQAGDVLPEQLLQGIAACNVFLLLWSAAAAGSSWVAGEWNRAYVLKKKIVPYVLDGAPMPEVLENLLFITPQDRDVGDAQLLRTVYGRDFLPDPRTLFPGKWRASVDVSGLASADYDLELRASGQVVGTGGAINSGIAGELAALLPKELGIPQFMEMRFTVDGSWSYEQEAKVLHLEFSVHGLGQHQQEQLAIMATGYEKHAITGRDLQNRAWRLQRLP